MDHRKTKRRDWNEDASILESARVQDYMQNPVPWDEVQQFIQIGQYWMDETKRLNWVANDQDKEIKELEKEIDGYRRGEYDHSSERGALELLKEVAERKVRERDAEIERLKALISDGDK